MSYIKPHKFAFFPKQFKTQPFNLLDVGSGSNSPTKTKQFYPTCNYYGIDRGNYRNSDADFKAMTQYYEMDLTELKFDIIPDNHFDVIVMSHVIEHLTNGDKVIEGLLPKLKKGGYIYIEFPGKKSLTLPSMRDTLNFYDDDTHVRVFSHQEVSGILEKNHFKVLKAGTRRHWPIILLFPFALVHQTVKYGYVPGGVFWDIMGFAEFVFAKKD